MGIRQSQEISIVQIAMKSLVDGSTKYVRFVNTSYFQYESPYTADFMFPILLSIGDVGVSHDQQGPVPFNGKITIDDSIGSFGVDRKFSDILQRYTIIGQSAVFSYFLLDPSSTESPQISVVGDTFWSGMVVDHESVSGDRPTMDIQLEARTFLRTPVTLMIDDSVFEGAPARSYAKHIPLIIGQERQVSAIQISPDGDTNLPVYAYGTQIGNTYKNSGVNRYYTVVDNGSYQQMNSTLVTTKLYGPSPTISTYNTVDGNVSLGVNIAKSSTSDNYVVSHGTWKYRLTSGTPTVTTFTVELYKRNSRTGYPETLISSGQSVVTWTTSISVNSDFAFIAPFENIIPLYDNSSGYMFVTRIVDTGSAVWKRSVSGTGSGFTYIDRIDDTAANSSQWQTISSNEHWWGLYGLRMIDETTSPVVIDNLGYSYVTFVQHDGYSTSFTDYATQSYQQSNLTNLEWIFEVNGLKDDSSGTITGTPDSLIQRPDHIIQMLTQENSASSWDFTAYSSQRSSCFGNSTYQYFRQVSGVAEGRQTLEDVCRMLMKSSASKIVLRNDGKLAVYPWGSHETTVAVLGADDFELHSWKTLDPSWVINDITVGFDKNLIYYNSIKAAIEGFSGDYLGISKAIPEYALFADDISFSTDIYGKRYLSSVVLDFVRNSESAETAMRHLLALYAFAPVIVVGSVPFEDYQHIQPMNVVEIVCPSLPCYFGASYNAQRAHYNGQSITNENHGYTRTRAQRYRGQVEGRRITLSKGEPQRITLTMRLILNPGDPT